ncbi:hypothetical protein H4R34_001489 [Dimargaris verticillata]|uniref:Hpc2-related domain-containing protein n=1 Tax=Dimargaris verticillata TaxID=2761393 RepID=A0A9W8B623_9FUNG|nr:hypothetical protein H4R34_001489 [Dimargaris verticillata]
MPSPESPPQSPGRPALVAPSPDIPTSSASNASDRAATRSPPAKGPAAQANAKRIQVSLQRNSCTIVSYADWVPQHPDQSRLTSIPVPSNEDTEPADDSDASNAASTPVAKPSFGDDAFFDQLLKNSAHYGDDLINPKTHRRKRARVVEDYDLHDPFIDDSDMQDRDGHENQLREEGFFVYFGPLEFMSDQDAAESPGDSGTRPPKKRKVQRKKETDKALTEDKIAGSATKARKKKPSAETNPDGLASTTTAKKPPKPKAKGYDSDSGVKPANRRKAPAASKSSETDGPEPADKAKRKPPAPSASKRRPSISQAPVTKAPAALSPMTTSIAATTLPVPVLAANPGHESEPEMDQQTIRPSIRNLIDHYEEDGSDFAPAKYHISPTVARTGGFPPYSDKPAPRMLPDATLASALVTRSADNTPSKHSQPIESSAFQRSTLPSAAPANQTSYASPVAPAEPLPSVTPTKLLDQLRDAAQKESFANQRKLPPSLKPILIQLAMATMRDQGADFENIGQLVAAHNAPTAEVTDRENDKPSGDASATSPNTPNLAYQVVTCDGHLRELLTPEFYTSLAQVIPYNKATIRKVIARLTLNERIKLKQQQAQQLFAHLTELIEPVIARLRRDQGNSTPPVSGTQISPATKSSGIHYLLNHPASSEGATRPGADDSTPPRTSVTNDASDPNPPIRSESDGRSTTPVGLDSNGKPKAATPKRFPWTDAMRQTLWKFVQAEIES